MTFDFTDDDRDTLRVLPSTPDAVLIAIGSRRQEPRVSDVRIPLGRVEEVIAGIRDAARTAAARQTTGQDDTEPDPTTADDPTPLRWGLGDVLHSDDDTVIVCLSGPAPDRAPYWLELDRKRAAALRDDLAESDPIEPQDHPGADLYVRLRKAGEDHDTAQALIYAHARMAVRQQTALNDAAPAVGQPAEAHDTDEAPLTAAERKFLHFALDEAAEEMSYGDGFTDEDQAALDSLRRKAGKDER